MENELNKEALGMKVKQFRKEKGYTAEKLADISHVSKSHINNIESANSNASTAVLVRIANALDVSVDVLLEDSLNEKTCQKARLTEYNKIIDGCSASEMKVILNTLKTLRESLREQFR